MNGNQIQVIELNGFNGLNNLTYLNLNKNKIRILQISNQSIFGTIQNLIELHLESNPLSSIKRDDLKNLTKLMVLNIKSNTTQLIEPNSFDFFPNINRLLISMPNISNENIYNIKDSLKARMVRKYVKWKYYSATHIENRIDINCSKTLHFMKLKILYNFLNEYIDINDFLLNCMNLSELRSSLNYLENSSVHQDEIINQFYLKDAFNSAYAPVVVIFSLMALSALLSIFYMTLKSSQKRFSFIFG